MSARPERESHVAQSASTRQSASKDFSWVSNRVLAGYSQSENDVKKKTNTEQQSKKLKDKEILVLNQHKKWTDDKNKKDVTCYQCNKKGHYKSQCSELAKKQLKNVNQAPVREMHVKEKDQHSQKTLQT